MGTPNERLPNQVNVYEIPYPKILSCYSQLLVPKTTLESLKKMNESKLALIWGICVRLKVSLIVGFEPRVRGTATGVLF